jgi:transitional endoplasmic reticulum ATPase
VIAGQCGAHFLSVDLKKETTEGIKNWFLRARENKPCILFFDEIDSIATSRDIGMAGTQEVVTQLLIEMDGMEELKQVVVIAATNRPHQIDSALMRPGRFDRLICIPLPDEAARREILKIQLRGKPVARSVDLQTLAAQTGNYSSADLSALCYEASMSLIRHSDKAHPAITMADFTVALDKIKASIAPEEIAYFEEMKTRYSR